VLGALGRRISLGGLWLVAALASSAEARAFCRTTTCKGDACVRDDNGCATSGNPLFWPGGCVGFSFQQALTSKLPADKVRATVRRSFLHWTSLPCAAGPSSLAFSEGPDSACKASGYSDAGPNINLILFQDFDFPYRGEDNTLAKTTVTFDSTGAILDADIEVNAAFNELTVSDSRVVYDLESILTHEIGHFIGLAHSPVPEATMFASYETGQSSLRSLEPDDVDALCAVYPPGRVATCDPTPRGGLQVCAADGSTDGGSSGGCALGGPGGAGPGALGAMLVACLAATQRKKRAV
jgi:hypothetical protein